MAQRQRVGRTVVEAVGFDKPPRHIHRHRRRRQHPFLLSRRQRDDDVQRWIVCPRSGLRPVRAGAILLRLVLAFRLPLLLLDPVVDYLPGFGFLSRALVVILVNRHGPQSSRVEDRTAMRGLRRCRNMFRTEGLTCSVQNTVLLPAALPP